jgi:uncharacterized protein (DUF3084 family)
MTISAKNAEIEELKITIKAREEDIRYRDKRIVWLQNKLEEVQWESDHWRKAYYNAEGDI